MGKTGRRSVLLKAGRPPLLTQSIAAGSLNPATKRSSKATRTAIRAHHNLHKSRAKALADGNQSLVDHLDAQIEQLGGLEAYQVASLTGQSRDRGGDSSILLVKWLEEMGCLNSSSAKQKRQPLRVLEVGALSSKNAISEKIGKGVECVKRLDLNSQEPGLIEEIDFMDLPVPSSDEGKFDLISHSLVLNYVPEAGARGEMLKRSRQFLRGIGQGSEVMPCLFFVLPLPCISNSRYMTTNRLQEIMTSLGYRSLRVHQSAKLHYELFHLNDSVQQNESFKKVEVNPGKSRNNFCITLASS